jgi:hypothetical protein
MNEADYIEEYENLKIGDMFSVKIPAGPALRKGQIVVITGFGNHGRKIFLDGIKNPYVLRMVKAFWNRLEFDNEELHECNKAKALAGRFCNGAGVARWAASDYLDTKKEFVSGGYFDPQGRQITECHRPAREVYVSLIIMKESPCLDCSIRKCPQHGLNFKTLEDEFIF